MKNEEKKWIIRVKRKDFTPSKTSRLCAKHFTNDQFVVNPILAASIGHTLKKLRLKPDAEPTIFDFSDPKLNKNEEKNDGKRKQRQKSGAIAKRKRIETLSQVFGETVGPGPSSSREPEESNITNMNVTSDEESEADDRQNMFSDPILKSNATVCYNMSCQTRLVVNKTFSCQTVIPLSTVNVATQTLASGREEIMKERCPSEDLNESFEDNILDDPDWTPVDSDDEVCTLQSDVSVGNVQPHKERKFLVFESKLDELLNVDCVDCGKKRNFTKTVVGTGLIVSLICNCKKKKKWFSQHMSGTMPLGNLLLAGAIMFTGAILQTTLNLLNHISVQCFSDRTFSSIQYGYLVPVISSVWTSKQSSMIEEIKNNHNGSVKLGGDARCCSPGHTAKYGSYSVMNLENNTVLDIQLIQSNEVKNSYAMELEGLRRCLSYLKAQDIVVTSLVTDRHSQVKKYLKEQHQDINHMFDVWHVAKGVCKKIEAVGKKKGCQALKKWARSISNHMYWCAASSHGDGEMVQQKWISILNHVCNIHTGHGEKFLNCEHQDLEEREWLKQGSKVFLELEKIIKGRLLMTDIKKLSYEAQTSSLESFHRINCFYAPKAIHYFHAQMEARLFISGLHFNENSRRAQAFTAEGKAKYKVSYPKGRKGEGVAKEVKTKPTFGYIDDLFRELLHTRASHRSYSGAFSARKRGDRPRPLPLSESTPRRPKDEIIASHMSRFNKN